MHTLLAPGSGSSVTRPDGSVSGYPGAAAAIVEELVVPPRQLPGGSRAHIVAVVSVAALAIAVGLSSGLFERSSAARQGVPPPSSLVASSRSLLPPAPLTIIEPTDGQAFSGGSILLRLHARDYSGTVRVAVWSGPLLLGSVDLDVRGPGEVVAPVPVLTPLVPLSAVMEVEWNDEGALGRTSRSVWLFETGGATSGSRDDVKRAPRMTARS